MSNRRYPVVDLSDLNSDSSDEEVISATNKRIQNHRRYEIEHIPSKLERSCHEDTGFKVSTKDGIEQSLRSHKDNDSNLVEALHFQLSEHPLEPNVFNVQNRRAISVEADLSLSLDNSNLSINTSYSNPEKKTKSNKRKVMIESSDSDRDSDSSKSKFSEPETELCFSVSHSDTKISREWNSNFRRLSLSSNLQEDSFIVEDSSFRRNEIFPESVKRNSSPTSHPSQCEYLDLITSLNAEIDGNCKRHTNAVYILSHFPGNWKLAAKFIYEDANIHVFRGQLPSDIEIKWNKRLTMTAGRFIWRKPKSDNQFTKCFIEMSSKLNNTVQRFRDTLLHEMCHVANVMIDNLTNENHGKHWKKWTKKVAKQYPQIPPIKTFHEYVTDKKYRYRCVGCNKVISGLHKLRNLQSYRCVRCHGRFVRDTKVDTNKKELNSFAKFVKDNYANTKSRYGKNFGDTMKMLSVEYRKNK
ncbi:hypothetical protein ACOME3_010044 [Neoechinorhynchus agilis]